MLCQYSRTAQPQALLHTLVSLSLLFSPAWAAPLSSHAKRSSGGSSIVVRPSNPHSLSSLLAHAALLLRCLLSWLPSSSSQSRCCSIGSHFFPDSGTLPFTLCWHRTNHPPLFKFGTLPRRKSPGQTRQQLRPRRLFAQSDGQDVIGAPLVKSRRAHCQRT